MRVDLKPVSKKQERKDESDTSDDEAKAENERLREDDALLEGAEDNLLTNLAQV